MRYFQFIYSTLLEKPMDMEEIWITWRVCCCEEGYSLSITLECCAQCVLTFMLGIQIHIVGVLQHTSEIAVEHWWLYQKHLYFIYVYWGREYFYLYESPFQSTGAVDLGKRSHPSREVSKKSLQWQDSSALPLAVCCGVVMNSVALFMLDDRK